MPSAIPEAQERFVKALRMVSGEGFDPSFVGIMESNLMRQTLWKNEWAILFDKRFWYRASTEGQ